MTKLPSTPGIYRFWNIYTLEEYIGSTNNLYTRWNVHKRYMRNGNHSRKVQAVYDEFGADCFVIEVVEHVELAPGLSKKERRDILLEIEQRWLDKCQPSLNTLMVAGSPFGYTHTEETKQKIRQAHLGRKQTPEARANMSAGQYRRYERAEEHEKSSARARGRTATLLTRIRMSDTSPLRGKKRDPELVAKSRAGLMGHPVSAETRAKIGEANRRIKATKRWLLLACV